MLKKSSIIVKKSAISQPQLIAPAQILGRTPSTRRPERTSRPLSRDVDQSHEGRSPKGARSVVPVRMLLVDDDQSFGAILKRSAAKEGHDLTVCHDLESLGRQMESPFAVALVDYDLGSVTGVEIVRYLETQAWNAPFVLISQSNLPQTEAKTRNSWSFVHKDRGPHAIIAAAMVALAADQAARKNHLERSDLWSSGST